MKLFFLIIPYLLAAPAPPHKTCAIEGHIISVDEREDMRDPSWAKSWGLDKKVTYTDINLKLQSVKLIKSELAGECTLEFFENKSFQLRPGQKDFHFSKGDCITAKTQFSGDEFLAGQWLWDIENCE